MSYTNIPGPGSQFKEAVPTAADLPTIGNQTGDVRTVQDTGEIYFWDGDSWESGGGGGPIEGTAILSTGEPAGAVLASDGAGGADWVGNVNAVVVGPASATDNAVARFDGTTGKLVQNSLATLNDQGSLAIQRATFLTNNVFLGSTSGAAITSGLQNVFIGNTSGSLLTTHSNNVFVGHATGNEATSVEESVVIGSQANSGTSAQRAVVIGRSAGSNTMTGTQNTIIGYSSGTAVTSGTLNVIIGAVAGTTLTTGSSNILIGDDAEPSAAGASNEMVVGSTASPITNVYFGRGALAASPQNVTLNATGASGADINGGDLTLAGGRSTGSGNGGAIIFYTSPAGSSGSSLNSLGTQGVVTSTGAWIIGSDNLDQTHTLNGAGCILATVTGSPFTFTHPDDNSRTIMCGGFSTSARIELNGSTSSTPDQIFLRNSSGTFMEMQADGTFSFGDGGQTHQINGSLAITNSLIGNTTLTIDTNGTNAGSIDANQRWEIGGSGNDETHILRGNALTIQRPNAGEDFTIMRDEDSGALGLSGGTSLGSGFLYLYGATSGQSGRVQLGSDNLPYIDIDGNGLVTIGSGNSQTHAINGAGEAADANVLTLTNGPVGTSGDPGIYLRLTVNGTTYVFPGWQLP